ncbi:MAG: thioredoxin family protein [Verrucomicrobiales bacterium]|nr:thioredoxin family protein [Verrucomicrobiota bacterium JB025]
MTALRMLSVSCAAMVALHSSAFAGDDSWTTDFAAAKKQAAAENKDLLVDFTGSDWCGYCIRLRKEVFAHDSFKQAVKDKFVLVELDYPRDTSAMSEETVAQNAELKTHYAIGSYPTVLLMDSAGKPYRRTGYKKGGPENYLKHLDELLAEKQKSAAEFAKADGMEGLAKANQILAAMKSTGLRTVLIASCYGDEIDQLKAADPEDQTGYAAREKKEVFEWTLSRLSLKKDTGGMLRLIDSRLVADGVKTGEKQKLMGMKARIFAQSGNYDLARKTLAEAKAIDPASKEAESFERFEKSIANKGVN